MSFRDITHNPDVIRALRELSKRGIYGKLEKERDRAAKSLQDKLRRRGIRSYIEVLSDREAYITIDLDSVAKYIDKNFKSIVTNNAKYFSYYDAENAVLQVHVWTGPTPKEVQRLKEEVEKA